MYSGIWRSSAAIPAAINFPVISYFAIRRDKPGFGAYPSDTAARASFDGKGIRAPRVMLSESIMTSGGAERVRASNSALINTLPHQIVDLRKHVVCDAHRS